MFSALPLRADIAEAVGMSVSCQSQTLCLPKNLIQCWLGGDFRGGKCRLRSMQANAQFRGYYITVETQWLVHMTAQLVGTRNSNRMKNAHSWHVSAAGCSMLWMSSFLPSRSRRLLLASQSPMRHPGLT